MEDDDLTANLLISKINMHLPSTHESYSESV